MNVGNVESVGYILPELLLVLTIVTVFLADLVVSAKERLGEIALAGAAVSLLAVSFLMGTPDQWLFTRMIVQDQFAVFFKLIFAAAAMAAIWMSLESKEITGANQGEYYGLRDVAASIWTYLATPQTLTELCERISAEYDVASEACRPDVAHFLDELVAKKLIDAVA